MPSRLHSMQDGGRRRCRQCNAAQTEHESGAASAHLDSAKASDLLRMRGYELVERFGHIHAGRHAQEWHVCLVADLASMAPSRFLAGLDEAIEQSVEHVLSLSFHP